MARNWLGGWLGKWIGIWLGARQGQSLSLVMMGDSIKSLINYASAPSVVLMGGFGAMNMRADDVSVNANGTSIYATEAE